MSSRTNVPGLFWSFARRPSMAIVVFRLRLSAFPSTYHNAFEKEKMNKLILSPSIAQHFIHSLTSLFVVARTQSCRFSSVPPDQGGDDHALRIRKQVALTTPSQWKNITLKP